MAETHNKIIVVVTGGVVQTIVTPPGFSVCLIDWDNIDAGDTSIGFTYPNNEMSEEEVQAFFKQAADEIEKKYPDEEGLDEG